MSVLLLILGLLLFVGLVVVHEFGHFIVARRNGIEVEEFGIGFPPRAKVFAKKRGTEYTLNWLPLGGFVKLKGEYDEAKEKGSFGAARLRTKAKVLLAGVGMNLLTAFVLFTLLALIGMPRLVENQFTVPSDTKTVRNDVLIGYIEPNSPAEKAGLRVHDKVNFISTSFTADQSINSVSDLPEATEFLAGKPVTVNIERKGYDGGLAFDLTLRSKEEVEASKKTDDPKGYLGVSPTEYTVRRSTWSAPVVALGTMWQFTALTFKGLGTAVAGLLTADFAKAGSQVGGPVAIFMLLKEGSLLGISVVLMIIALISLTLAIMNVLPIPALDGGRLFVTLLFRALRQPLTRAREEKIHGSGFVALLLLSALIIVLDITRL